MTATKIVALSQAQPTAPGPGPEDDPEPARRKRHLALYIGGGVAAVLASLGERLRSLWRTHRTATAIATASAVVVTGTAAAMVLTADDTAPASARPAPFSAQPYLGDIDISDPTPGAGKKGNRDGAGDADEWTEGGITTDVMRGTADLGRKSTASGKPSSSPSRSGDDEGSAPTPANPSTPGTPGATPAPSATEPAPTAPPTQAPAPPPSTTPPAPSPSPSAGDPAHDCLCFWFPWLDECQKDE
ncbi:hypothetical protein ABT301_18095 [Streptomyces sp. NPDC000987]|uniref:hypothetical protein n=1 Tax=Streptomyces sp. NPDC000987 TaxID=3154374 RepID=UPI00331D7DE4